VVVHLHDIREDPEFGMRRLQTMQGFRTILAVPMIRGGVPIGALARWRREVRPFADPKIGLVQTFADQAVIAIENVRLFTELQTSNREPTESLEQQTATSEILRVISRSQTDAQLVFDAIVSSAVRLLGAYGSVLSRLVGETVVLAAFTRAGEAGDAALQAEPSQTLQSEGVHCAIIRDRVPLNSEDAPNDPGLPAEARRVARARGIRSLAGVPLLRHGEAVGAITVSRPEPGGFTEDEIVLLTTFADQAVIAIENARLLTELQARTGELTRSAGELRALSEVGQAISSTLDLETVLNTIVARAVHPSRPEASAKAWQLWGISAPEQHFL